MQRGLFLGFLIACGAPAKLPDPLDTQQEQRAPSAPSVTVSVADKRVTLNWNNAGVGVGYQILRGRLDEAEETLVATTTANTYLDDDQSLVNCERYIYRVRAQNPLGNAESDPVEAVPTSDVSCWEATRAYPRWSDAAQVGDITIAVGDRNYYKRTTGGGLWTNIFVPNRDGLDAIVDIESKFVAASPSGDIFASTDGARFTKIATGITGKRLVRGGSRLFRIDGTIVRYSEDSGKTWSAVDTGAPSELIDIDIGYTRIVAAYTGGVAWTTDINSAWSYSGQIGTGSIVGVAYGEANAFSGFVAVTSTGELWRWVNNGSGVWEVIPNQSYPLNPIRGLAFGNGVWAIVFVDGHVLWWDGASTPPAFGALPAMPATNEIEAIRFANAQFHVLGAGDMIMASANGNIWDTRSLGGNWNAIEVGQKTAITVGSSGKIARSTDSVEFPIGEAWSETSIPGNFVLRGIAYGLGKWVACGNSAQGSQLGAIFVSNNDGQSWTQTVPGTSCATVRFLNNRFYAGRRYNSVWSWDGTDLAPWVERFVGDGGTNAEISDIAYGNGNFLAVSNGSGAVYRSTNGETWSPAPGTLHPYFLSGASGIGFMTGAFMAYGRSPGLARSTDGGIWMPIAAEYNFTRVRTVNTKTVAVGNSEFLYTSTNGTTWVQDMAARGARIRDFVQVGSRLVGVGPDALYLRKPPTK